MSESSIDASLRMLRKAADSVRDGFPATTWTRVRGAAEPTLTLGGNGWFSGFNIGTGEDLELTCDLSTPEQANLVKLTDEPLEATINSLYPVKLEHDGVTRFEAHGVPVASGPALFTLVPKLATGKNGQLRMLVTAPPYQTTPWMQLNLTTRSLRMRFEELDFAWAQLATANALAITDADREAVRRGLKLAQVLIDNSNAAERQSAARQIGEALSPMRQRIASLKVHLIGHSHIDMNWMWTWEDTVEVLVRDFRSVLNLMEEFPELKFSHSQPGTYEVIRQREPAMFAKVLQHITDDRWEATTMQWIEGDLNMASGEAQARQLLEGVRYSREVLKTRPGIFHCPDTFGHPGNIPQLAASAGTIGYYHHRANPGKADIWPAYWWEGQDGTRILCFSTTMYNGEITAGDIASAAIRAHRAGHHSSLHFHGIGDHGGGPSRHNMQTLRRIQATPGMPTSVCSTMRAYVTEIRKCSMALPTFRGESATIFEACYTTHADTKLYNRAGENLLCAADTLSVLAGLDRHKELTAAWRKVLFNQFHDILDGSAIHEAYERNKTDFEEVRASAEKVIDESLAVLQGGMEAGTIAVTNPLAFDREDWVSVAVKFAGESAWLASDNGHIARGQVDADGSLGFVARVAAFSTVAYKVQTTRPADVVDEPALSAVPDYAQTDRRHIDPPDDAAEKALYFRIETDHFTAYVRRDSGIIVSLVDKRVGRELVSFGLRRTADYTDQSRADLAMNVFQLLQEENPSMTAWQLREVSSEQSFLRGATVSVAESGPQRLVLLVKHTLRSSTIEQRIIFYRRLPRIDFDTRIDWQEIGSKETGIPNLKVAFTARLDDCQAWYETPFAAVKRPADGQEVPLRWADVGGDDYGIALLNDSKYGHDALGCRLRLSLVRCSFDPDYRSDSGPQHVRFSLVPHAGNWRDAQIVRQAAAFNQPMLTRKVETSEATTHAIMPLRLEGGSSVEIACLKRPHEGAGMIVRLYESAGRAQTVSLRGIPAGSTVVETNIVEDVVSSLQPDDGVLQLAFGPWQVRTLKIG